MIIRQQNAGSGQLSTVGIFGGEWLNDIPGCSRRTPHEAPRRVVRRVAAALGTMLLALNFFSCAATKTSWQTPEAAVEGIRNSVSEDRRLEFLGSLSLPMLREYEHAILLGWPEVRGQFGYLAEGARVESVEPVKPMLAGDPEARASGEGWVWPDAGTEAVRVRLAVTVDGEPVTEDLLFVRELLPEEEGTEGSRRIRVGEQWFVRERHPNPHRYSAPSAGPEYGWKLLAPYWPYQGGSRLAHILRNRRKTSPENENR